MAGGPGGPIVGRVRLRVAPDVSGFRREVEKQMAGLRDAEVNINPDMDGFRKKVNASTRGLKATVATDLNSRGLRKDAAKAAKAASGHKVYFRQEWRNRIKGPGIGPRDKDLRTLGSDLKFLGSQAKDITLYPLRRSADAASGAISRANLRMKNLKRGTSEVATSFGRGMTRRIKGIGRLARNVMSPAVLLGQTVRWATFGPQIERGIVKSIGGIRKKIIEKELGKKFHDATVGALKRNLEIDKAVWRDNLENLKTGSAREKAEDLARLSKAYKGVTDRVKKYAQAVSRPIKDPFTLGKTDGAAQKRRYADSVKRVNQEIASFKKLGAARKAFNRQGKKYNAELHQQYNKLVNDAKKLNNVASPQAREDLPRILDDIEKIRKKLGGTDAQAKKFAASAKEAREAFKEIGRFTKAKDRNLRIFRIPNAVKDSERVKLLIQRYEKVQEKIRKVGRGIQQVGTRIRETGTRLGESFKGSKAYAEIERMGRGVDKVRSRFQKLNESFKKISITNVARKFSKDTRRTADPVKPLADSTKKFAQSLGGTIPQLKSFRQEVDSIGGSSERAAQRVSNIGKSAKKSTGTLGKLKKAWGKFHQPENRIFGLTEMGWMTAAITALIAPLSGLIGGVLGSLPALGLAAAAALGATVLGWEGIKEAASAAAPAVENAKKALSSTFKDRLTPQFESLGEGLTKITPDLDKVANGLSDFSQGMVDAVTSDSGIKHLQKGLGNTADLFSKLKPFATDFTAGLLEMGSAGSETFDYLGDKLNNFGTSFRESVSEMADTGVLQDSIESMYDVVGSIGNNLGKVMRAGMEELPDMADSFTRGLDDIGDGLVAIMPLLSDFSQGVFDIFGALGRGVEKAAPALTEIFDGIGPGFRDALSGLGDLGGAVLNPVSSFLTGLAPGVGDTLSGIGDGFSLLADGINELNGPVSAGKIGTLDDAFHSFGTTVGEFLPAMFGAYNDSVEELEAPDPDDYEGFLGFLSFSADQYIHDIKTETEKITTAIGEAQDAVKEAFESGDEGVMTGARTHNPHIQNMAQEATRSIQQAAEEIVTAWDGASGDIEGAISSIKESAQSAMEDFEVDLTPQIKKLDTAKTEAEVREIQAEIAGILQGFSGAELDSYIEDIVLEPEISVDPKMDMEGAISNLYTQATTATSSLSTAIDQFVVDAEAIGEAAEINIKPQIKAVEGASDPAQFQMAAKAVLDELQAAAEPEQVDVDIDPQAQMVDEGEGLGSQIEEQVSGAIEGVDLNSTVQESLDGALGEIDFTETASGVGTALGDALGGIDVPMDGLSQSITTSLDTVKTDMLTSFDSLGADAGTKISAALNSVSINADGLKNIISSTLKGAVEGAGTEAASAAGPAAEGIITAFTEALGGLADAAAEAVSDLPSTMETKGGEAGESMASGLEGAQGSVSGAATGLKTAAVLAVANISLYSSGLAAGNSFASGLRASIPTVESAAGDVAGAARAFFPNSPADKGAFSAGNYVDKSGMAVARDFANGMLALVPKVEKAAGSVTAAAHKKFQDFASDPAFKLEDFHRNQILQPVLEGNARKIHDWREREAESAERLQERIAEINESDSEQAKKEERIAKAREDSAERSVEAKERLMESLETPEYRDIDRSIQSYYIDGMRNVLTDGLLDIAKEVDLAGQTREIALAAVKEGRKAFGSHPLFDTVEASVTADHFARVLQKVIEDSGIAEIPVDFAVSNLDQLKRDLGMGDGVISRALDQAISVDPAATDARWARQNPVEIHYHVKDMEAAIRLEQERERKGMMKYR